MRKSLLLLIILLASCASQQPAPNSHPWANALRALDPADAPTPAHDITAVYLREQGESLQIRIDLLAFNNPKDVSLEIKIESASTPQPPPLIIHIPSQIESPCISLDPQLATVIVDVPQPPPRPRVDVSTPEDQLTDLTMDSPAVTQTAPLLLTFYDTFAARLPAEALRSWDGAHTGPRGERHGLKHLLEAVEAYQIPIVPLDLKQPEILSALDAMGLLPQIETLENQSLLIFPENNTTEFKFTSLEDPTHLYRPLFSKTTYLPICTETDVSQPTPDGPSLEVRRALLETALNTDKTDLLVLGGNLADSTWGSPDMVSEAMAYFASRPYIHVLKADDLLKFPVNGKNTIVPQPEDATDDETLQVQSALEYANAWAENPPATPLARCQSAFPECVLANEQYLAVFDREGATLTHLFSVGRITNPPRELHQLIGPSWQVAPGIDLYPGAFADDKEYQADINGDSLIFTSTDGARTKIFTLAEAGLEVFYQTQESVTVQIPLLVNPDERFTPGWAKRYVGENTPNGIRWGLENGSMVSVQADGAVTMHAFNESLDLLVSPEDPDFEYPPGHYVPFPMAILSVDIPNTGSRLLLSAVSP